MVASIGSSGSPSYLRALDSADKAKEKSLNKLSSGKKNPLDDPAAAAIVAELEADVATLDQAARNISDASSLMAIGESALANVSDTVTRITELSVQAANGTYSQEQRQAMQNEVDSLSAEINRTIQSAEFNGQKIFDSASNPKLDVQVGNSSDQNSRISFDFGDLSTQAESLLSIDLMSPEGRTSALSTLNSFQTQVNSTRGQMGAFESRLAAANETARTSSITAEAAASRIRDIDYAEETANLTRNNILAQGSVAMAAQANVTANTVLSLLR
ncbi:MAG: hypothetical protein GX589_02040 [Deltaproteobacteria bacterium]|nr:hypothetical protein [Deltaproteobacteria bacterium]